MSTSALIVEVQDTERGHRREYVFARSPIRVGRSPLNDLPLDRSFVSHCHGLLHFDGSQIEFVDVGSTNGTFMGSKRLEKNRPTALGQGGTIAIGALQLRVRVDERNSADTHTSYAFRALAASDLGEPEPRARPAGSAAPAEAVRAVEARASAGERNGVEARAGSNEARSAQLLERFARSFLELRRGQHQLLRDLGLPVPNQDRLQTIESARELLSYLLEPDAPPGRIDELSRACADLMMHEVALLNAVNAGARELLEELSPSALSGPLSGGVLGWLARLFGRDGRWRSFRRKFDELQEETALSSVVLGRTFMRAYAAALGHGSGTRRKAAPTPVARPS